MVDRSYTAADLELFIDFERAAGAARVTPCLIGAGAIQLGADLRWTVRLTRTTRDWDFAVRVSSWPHYDELSQHLVAGIGGFVRTAEPHRFRHRSGGLLDVVPYGDLEDPPGTLRWSDGTALDTTGLSVLDEHHVDHGLGPLVLRTASLPAIVGLKLLAYGSRRPGITRDIADLHDILRGVEDSVSDERVAAEGLERLGSGEVGYGEIGAYLLGREVGRAFPENARETMQVLLEGVSRAEDPAVRDVLRSASGTGVSSDLVSSRLVAFRWGVIDR